VGEDETAGVGDALPPPEEILALNEAGERPDEERNCLRRGFEASNQRIESGA